MPPSRQIDLSSGLRCQKAVKASGLPYEQPPREVQLRLYNSSVLKIASFQTCSETVPPSIASLTGTSTINMPSGRRLPDNLAASTKHLLHQQSHQDSTTEEVQRLLTLLQFHLLDEVFGLLRMDLLIISSALIVVDSSNTIGSRCCHCDRIWGHYIHRVIRGSANERVRIGDITRRMRPVYRSSHNPLTEFGSEPVHQFVGRESFWSAGDLS